MPNKIPCMICGDDSKRELAVFPCQCMMCLACLVNHMVLEVGAKRLYDGQGGYSVRCPNKCSNEVLESEFGE